MKPQNLLLFVIFTADKDMVEPLPTYQESVLIKRIAGGDEAAFRQIFHHYNQKLFPVILSLVRSESDAREIIQEVFIKFWLGRASLPGIANPGGWLYTMACNAAYDFIRSRATYQSKLRQLPTTHIDRDLEEQLEAKFAQALIEEAVSHLAPRRRQVFQMAHLQGYSRKEIAEKLEISEYTVRNQLVEAVAFVQEYLEKHASVYLPAVLICLHQL
jgi:RNA polymerase sigma-70 factor (ECF subfamily)